jgi:hypothetical protein
MPEDVSMPEPADGDLFSPPDLGGGPVVDGVPPADPTPPDPTPPPPDLPPDPTPSPSIREALTAKGYDVSQFENDQAAIDGMLATAEAYHQAQPLISAGQRYSPHAAEFDTWLEEREKAASPVAPPPPASGQAATAPAAAALAAPAAWEWKPPAYDPSWEAHARQDPETGQYVPRTQFDSPAAAQNLNKFHAEQARLGREIVLDFPNLVRQATSAQMQEMRADFEKQTSDAIGKALGQYRSEQQSSQYFRQHEADLFQVDEQGRKMIDPRTGREALSPKGQAFQGHVAQGRQWGISDDAQLIQFAEAQVSRDEQAGLFAAGGNGGGGGGLPQLTAEQLAEQRKGEFLASAVRGGQIQQRTGTFPTPNSPADSGRPDETLEDIIEDEKRRAGIPS